MKYLRLFIFSLIPLIGYSQTTVASDNFDSDTVGSIAPNFANAAGTWIVGTRAPISSPNTFQSGSGANADAVLYTGTTALGDMQVTYDEIYQGTDFISPILRMNSGYTTGYTLAMSVVSGSFAVTGFKRISSVYSLIGTANTTTGITATVSTTYHVKAQIVGTSISLKIWSGGSEPGSFQYNLTDSAVGGTGFVGFYNQLNGGSSNSSIDNFSLVDPAGTPASLSAAPTSLAFGNHVVTTTSASQAVTISNTGSLTATISSIVISGTNAGDFADTTTCGATLAGGANCAVNVTFTPSAIGARSATVTVTDTPDTLTASATLTGTGTASGTTILPNDASIVYSPGNWDVTSARALSINGGAYFSTLFTGTSVTINFSVASLGSPTSQIYYRIDNYSTQSPWTEAPLAATVTPTMPTNTAGYQYHLLEVMFKSSAGAINRWNSPSATAVQFTGLTLAASQSAAATNTANGSILIFGDSITEGDYTVAGSGSLSSEPDRYDAAQEYSYNLRRLLGVEIGVIGFGSQGWSVPGAGNVPAFSTTYTNIMSGISRNTSISNLKAIVINHGTNDTLQGASDAAVTAAVITVLNGMITAYPNIPIIVMRAFNGDKSAAILAGIAGCSVPGRITYMDTTGFFNAAFGSPDGTHPYGANATALISPLVAAQIKKVIYPTGKSYSFF